MNIKEILREELNKFDSPNKNIVYAYHGSRSSGEKKPHDGMFFALDKWYAESIGGSFLHKAELTINNPLYLDKYNKILIKNGINGSYAQPPLTISNFNIKLFNPIVNSSVIFKKKYAFWIENGIEDYELWIRLWKQKCHIFNCNRILVAHRIHAASAFNSKGHSTLKKDLLNNI